MRRPDSKVVLLLEKFRLWFSPTARFIAQQQAIGKSSELIEIELKLLKAREWLESRKSELFERENPRPIPQSVTVHSVFGDNNPHATKVDWITFRKEMEVWEDARDEAMAAYLVEEEQDADGKD